MGRAIYTYDIAIKSIYLSYFVYKCIAKITTLKRDKPLVPHKNDLKEIFWAQMELLHVGCLIYNLATRA